MIGIVGGIGPLAGIDLHKKIIENTIAQNDQDHISIFHISMPSDIIDRTEYLLGNVTENPAFAIFNVITLLNYLKAQVIGIACNSAHAPPIFNIIKSEAQKQGMNLEIINMVQETVDVIRRSKRIQNVGVLCTSGSYKTKIYQNSLLSAGLTPVLLEFEQHHSLVHDAIYNKQYGIKASTEDVRPQALLQLNRSINELKKAGAEALLLGCTELGMIQNELELSELTCFNPNTILARALIRKVAPDCLRPIE